MMPARMLVGPIRDEVGENRLVSLTLLLGQIVVEIGAVDQEIH